MLINSTIVSIPYTAKNSQIKRSMNLLCELYKYNQSKSWDLYEGNIDATIVDEQGRTIDNSSNFFEEDVVYKGIIDPALDSNSKNLNKCYIKENPIKYSEIKINKTGKIDSSNYYTMRVYFPLECIHTYYKAATKYLVSIYTYVKEDVLPKRLYLYSNVIDSFDNLACAPKIYKGNRYQEYQDINIYDFYELINRGVERSEYIIHINIQPVYVEEDSAYAFNDIKPGNSSLSYYKDSILQVIPSFDIINRKVRVRFERNGDNVNIFNYIYDNYEPNMLIYLRYFIVNKYDEIIYIDNPVLLREGDESSIAFDDLFGEQFKSWSDWEEGMQLYVSTEAYAYKGEMEEKDLEAFRNKLIEGDWIDCFNISIASDTIPITSDIYKFILPNDIDNINLTDIDMTINSYNVTNEIINKNINVNQTSVSNGLVKPVFFKAYDISKIKVHRDIYENICVNLDEYKNKVNKFYIKICGNYFVEYARTIDGVIFNINGAVITSNTGTYYICDADKNFITSGKYECE